MKKFLMLFFTSVLFIACSSDDTQPDPAVSVLDDEVNDFVWKGLNDYYLWKGNVTNLADDKDDNRDDYFTFLNNSGAPEDLFESLLYQPETIDKYSWIVDDYIALEQQFSGVSKSNGVDFQLVLLSNDDIFGYVKYILPNSDASNKNIERGDLFLEVDGQQLTLDNYIQLLFGENDSYTLGLAEVNGSIIDVTGETVSLTKEVYTENPVYITKTFNKNGQKIGYLMYNSFTSNFDGELNAAFGQLKAEGVTDLVLDLRYNGGGSVRTSRYLASMITGQFDGQLLAREKWNTKWQQIFENQAPQLLVNNFTNEIINTDSSGNVILQEAINSLGLTKLYIIATGDTASASELIINGLRPYIDVTLIGETTEGKAVGSITLYDSDNFTRSGSNLNTNHFYAMQPITVELVNKLGENDINGFPPDISLQEDLTNMGVLGEESDPLLERALSEITGTATRSFKELSEFAYLKKIAGSKDILPLTKEMYLEKDKEFYDFLKEHN